MRKLFIAGNWKMNLDGVGAVQLCQDLKTQLAGCGAAKVDVAVFPPFVYLPIVAEALRGSTIAMGAQDVWTEGNGAFTGEVSVDMLKDVGCTFVLVGHSERRHVIGETNELLNKKAKVALAGGLNVIFCIGELLEERQGNKTEAVVEEQIRLGLAGITAEQMANVTIAYEPVWAIGTGVTASKEQAQEAHAFTRKILTDLFGAEVAEATRIQYGGSVKGANAAELTAEPDVDGALVGGASLKADDFMAIINNGASNVGGCGGCCCG